MIDDTTQEPVEEQADVAPYLFDDFFITDEDKGVEVLINVGGRALPFHIRQKLSLSEKQEAQSAAVRKQYLPNGAVKILGVDEKRATIEVLVRAIRSWPFTFKNGQPVPITRENIAKLDSEVAEALSNKLKMGEDAKVEALVPFESPSDAA